MTLTRDSQGDWQPVPILMYHAVENANRPPQYKHFYVTAKEFAWQMKELKRQGYQPISFAHLRDAMADNGILPEKPILLTFDDGYDNLHTNVHPILTSYNWPYTVFLVSEKIGKTNDWVVSEGFEDTPLLSWDKIQEMASSKIVDFQPHTKTHPKLDKLNAKQIREEIVLSKEELEQKLQKTMDVLCYPYGAINDEVVKITGDSGYSMAVTTEFGRVRKNDNVYRLPRISIYHVPPVSLTYGIGGMNYGWRIRTRKDNRPSI